VIPPSVSPIVILIMYHLVPKPESFEIIISVHLGSKRICLLRLLPLLDNVVNKKNETLRKHLNFMGYACDTKWTDIKFMIIVFN
jgi:hypothetical protein